MQVFIFVRAPNLRCVSPEETVLGALAAVRLQRSLTSRALGPSNIDTEPTAAEVFNALQV